MILVQLNLDPVNKKVYMDNNYQILGVENYCNDQEKIKKAYRTQVKFFHPDSNNVSKEMSDIKTKQLNIAYDFLSDPKKKKIYDQELHMVLEGKAGTQRASNNSKAFNQGNINKEEPKKKEEKSSKTNKDKNVKTTNKDAFKFCRYCGNKLNDNEMYCRKCGKKVN